MNLKEKLQGLKSKVAVVATTTGALITTVAVKAHASTYTPGSLLGAESKTLIQNTTADLKLTVVELIGILVPAGLAMWGIGWAVKKGIGFLQKRASKAV
jgi:hypothetical protein